MAGGLAVVGAAAGCSGVHQLSYPTPPASTGGPVVSAPVTLPNLTGAREAPVAGAAVSPPVPVGPGQATIRGTVVGPTGPVAGATVEADRFVGDGEGTARATTAADGTFSFAHVLGGRWRIRAWQAPNLDLTTPQVFFLGAGSVQTASLSLESFTTPAITGAMNPAPPTDGQPFNLVVQVENPAVTTDGIVSYAPLAGVSVTLVGGAEWTVTSPNPGVTDGNGVAAFQLVCSALATPSSLTAAAAGIGNQDLNVPGCVSAPTPQPPSPVIPTPTTTSSTTVPATTATTSTPSTTKPHRRTTTTTTRHHRR